MELKKRISDLLREIGVPAHLQGYQYLRESIIMVVGDISIIGSTTKKLYPAVSERFRTTPSKVERNIRHAIEVAWDRGDQEILQKYFGNTVSNKCGKPTNSEFIVTLADFLSMEETK